METSGAQLKAHEQQTKRGRQRAAKTNVQTLAQGQTVAKVRRTRQARNPQLSVARRNERERNRVKMVNNGFALLRDHLPVEYLQSTGDEQTSEPATPDLASNRSCSSKAKKFSKVETLRAAIQHIKSLVQVLQSIEPDFKGAQIEPSGVDRRQSAAHCQSLAQSRSQAELEFEFEAGHMLGGPMAALDEPEGPASVCEPLSCASSSSLGSQQSSVSLGVHRVQRVRHFGQPALQQPQQQHRSAAILTTGQHELEQFVKLEPSSVGQVCQPSQLGSPLGHIDDRTLNEDRTRTDRTITDHIHEANRTQLYNHQQQVSPASLEQSGQSHTHLWIQQHQESFVEQQQQQQQHHHWFQEGSALSQGHQQTEQAHSPVAASPNQQHQMQSPVDARQLSPAATEQHRQVWLSHSHSHSQSHSQSQMQHHHQGPEHLELNYYHQQQQQQQQPHAASFYHQQQSPLSSQQATLAPTFAHHQHQISLYSQ